MKGETAQWPGKPVSLLAQMRMAWGGLKQRDPCDHTWATLGADTAEVPQWPRPGLVVVWGARFQVPGPCVAGKGSGHPTPGVYEVLVT